MNVKIQRIYFKWFQLIHAIPKSWKKDIKIDQGKCRNLLYLNLHLIKKTKFTPLKSSEQINFILFPYRWEILCLPHKNILKFFFPSLSFTWKNVYVLPRIVTINNRLRVFQYKVLNNVLYLNKHPYIFKLSDTKLCFFCNQEDEIIIHLFAKWNICLLNKTLWNSLKEFFINTINFPSLTPQSAIFGFLQTDQELFLILNYFLLLKKRFFVKKWGKVSIYF